MAHERADTQDRLCGSVTKDGSPCTARRVSGSQFCFFHDPKNGNKRERGRKAGGRKNRPLALPRTTPEVRLGDSNDVVHLLADTINQVRRGEIDPKVANAVGYLANLMLKAQERGEAEGRLAVLEAAVKTQHDAPDYQFDEEVEGPQTTQDK
jgi:hypothetical protein